MITRIGLKNFKSWQELDLECRQLTILFGPNSSGKTSVLDALLGLKQTAATFDRAVPLHFGGRPNDLVDLGSFRELVLNHDESRSVSIGFTWIRFHEAPPAFVPGSTTYDGTWASVDSSVVLDRLSYETGGHTVSATRDGSRYVMAMEHPGEEPDRWVLRSPPESCYAFPVNVFDGWVPQRAFGGVVDPRQRNHSFEEAMGRIAYLGPLREYAQRRYVWTGEARTTVDPKGGGAVEMLMGPRRHAAQYRQYAVEPDRQPELERQTAEWLRRLNLADEFVLRPLDDECRLYEARARATSGAAETNIADMGFGVSQVLPLIVMLLSVPEGSIVLLEQPEIHLHAGVQADLADLFLEVAHERKLQLIIESHSEHLLTRLQRRIAEAQLPLAKPESIAMYFCEIAAKGSRARPVEVDEYGTVTNWPDGFFGDVVGELEAKTRAELGRKRAASGDR